MVFPMPRRTLLSAGAVLALSLAGLLMNSGVAQAHEQALTGEQRLRLLAILPERVAAHGNLAPMVACLEAGQVGDDRSLIALANWDMAVTEVKKETDRAQRLQDSGASFQDIVADRVQRSRGAELRRMSEHSRAIRDSGDYCNKVLERKEALEEDDEEYAW